MEKESDPKIILGLVDRLVLNSRQKISIYVEIVKYYVKLFDQKIKSVQTFQVYDSYGKKSTAYSNLQFTALIEIMDLHRTQYLQHNMISIEKIEEMKIRNKYTYIFTLVWNEIKQYHPFKPGR